MGEKKDRKNKRENYLQNGNFKYSLILSVFPLSPQYERRISNDSNS